MIALTVRQPWAHAITALRGAESDSPDIQTPGHQDSPERPPAAATRTGAAKPATTIRPRNEDT